jgi:uncharacterized protein YbaP (TraB family)
VHALPRGVDWFRPHVLAALDSADVLVLETVMPDGPAGALPTVMRLSRLQTPRPVMERVPPDWRPTLQAAIDRLQPGPLDWYKSWYVALTIANRQAEMDGSDPRIGVEAVLTARARMRDKPVEALETMEQQLLYFDALSEADQQQLLLSTLSGLPASKSRSTKLVGDWLLGDGAALAQALDQDLARSPMLKRMLIDERNARWAAWIAEQMKTRKGHIFVAVGAGHMAGPRNLLDALKLHGLEAKPVLAEPPKRRRR